MTKTNVRRALVAASISATVLAAACGDKEADAKSNTPPEPAVSMVGPENIAVVKRETIASGPAISGALAAEREATVRAQIAGPILSTHADEGSRVSTGTILARIDDRTLRDQFLSARSGVTTAQTASDIAARELSRNEKLAAAGAIAERDLEGSRRTNIATQSQLADAQARLTLAQKQLDDAQVRAPFSGVVSTRSVNAGDVVQPGGALFTIIDPSSMRLEASVPASQLETVRIGVPARFTVNGYPNRTFEGKVSRINPAADPATGQVRIVISIPNAKGGLVGGLFAEGRLASASRDGITAPSSAVDVRGLKPAVLRLKGGRAERVEVAIGLRDEEKETIEIVNGVSPGDTLLIGAAQGVSPGTPVRVSSPSDKPVAKR